MAATITLEEESVCIDRAIQVLSTICHPSVSGIPTGTIKEKIVEVNERLRNFGARWRAQYGRDEKSIFIDESWTSCPDWVKKMVETLCPTLYPHIQYAVCTQLPEIYLQIKRGEWTPLPDEDFIVKGRWGVLKKGYVRKRRHSQLKELWIFSEKRDGRDREYSIPRIETVTERYYPKSPQGARVDFSNRRYQPELPHIHFDITHLLK